LIKEREIGELKNWFMSLISHEFRTPMAIIQSSSEIIRRYADRMSVEVRERHLQHITSQVSQLNNLLADYSLVLHAQDGRLEFQPSPQDLVVFCQRLAEEYRLTTSQSHDLIFVCDNDIDTVLIDSRFLGYILRNLLSNAIKYSPEGGEVRFRVSTQGDTLVFEVSDEGIGIPEDALEHIFDAYQRADNVGTIRGTGIGLNIVRLCVEAHGGEIEVESAVDQGSTFRVTLPLVNAISVEIDAI
jgi:signal transduction histidine kinase